MARSRNVKTVDRGQAHRYLQAGQTFLAAATALATIAAEDESYGNAIALLAVHAAISHADAVVIAYAGQKSASGDHRDAVQLLRALLLNQLPDQEEKALQSLLAAKDAVAYQGKYYPLTDAQQLLRKASAFAKWAEQKYQQRRA